ncbi:hypothetical protein CAPTEDRAFT_214066 [Capitella teleta]|uniref:Uncharacterized protein n=1 Tax=Capitella teleta TaxID=283909 RepID=R7TKR1_CAPTE|nr:hypothetical protein CAPTEDRAFT_214066 [Capitella teleta]|eukprot:ELT94092.1 hypothetical protein CAPTEDRAFT_214066 [Capitella teleta]
MSLNKVDRISPKVASSISFNVLGDSTDSLKTFRKLLRDSFGPNAKASLVHNNKGGHVSLTTSSRRLLSALSISKPLLKLITAAANQHLIRHHDNGKLILLLATELIIRGLEADAPQLLTSLVFERLTPVCTEHLSSIRASLDTSHIDGLLSVIAASLSSKPLCLLSKRDAASVSQVLLKTVVSTDGAPRIICVEGLGPAESQLINGVLLPGSPDKSFINRSCFKFVLFNISLSGDSEDLPNMEYEVTSRNDLTDGVVGHISSLVPVLRSKVISLVLCQKVIHPKIKRKLKEAGISSIERLGLEAAQQVQALTGCPVISSLVNPISDDQIGMMQEAEAVEVGHKSFLRLSSERSACTLVLCHRSEEAVSELKSACESAIYVTRQLLLSPWVLRGAGHWQRDLANHIDKKVRLEKHTLSRDLGCSASQVATSSGLLSASLDSIASLLPSSDSVRDDFASAEAAVRSGVSVAALALSIHASIQPNV